MIRCLAVVTCLLFSSILADTYYVDATGGLDGNNGKSTGAAWKTLDKVNGTAFSAGDSVLFKRGESWNGDIEIWNAGSPGNPIVFSAYGTGDKPLINGQGNTEATIFINNGASHIIVDGFAVTNFEGADVFDGAEGKRSGIRSGFWGGNQTNITIRNNEVYFIEGCSNHNAVGSPRGTTLDKSEYHIYNNAGIFINATTIDSVLIKGNYVHNLTCTGIFVFCYEMAHHVVIESNAVYNTGADGIELVHADSCLVQYNSSIKAGNNSGENPRGPGVLGFNGLAVAGIWSYGSDAPVFQYNYCESTVVIKWDGQAWDFDIDVTGEAVYQYNYSCYNEGGFNLGGEPEHICRYNISYNDGSHQAVYGSQGFFCGSPKYYNNIFYRDDNKGFVYDGGTAGVFRNNIFHTNGTTNIDYNSSGRTFENNFYSGHTPVNPGQNGLVGDPMFDNSKTPGQLAPREIPTREKMDEIAAFFRPKAGSPCLDAGMVISNNGGTDYAGTALYDGNPDIGAFEGAGTPAVPDGEICRIISSPTIDGDNTEFGDIPEDTLENNMSGSISSDADLSARFRIVWDNDALYLAVKVSDDVLQADTLFPWDDDAIEVFIDGNNDKTTAYGSDDIQIIIRRTGTTVHTYKDGSGHQEDPAGITAAQAEVTGGYVVELKVEWSALGVTPSADHEIGFDIHVDDDDDGDGRDKKIAWIATADASATNTGAFGTLVLKNGFCPHTGIGCSRTSRLFNGTENDMQFDLLGRKISGASGNGIRFRIENGNVLKDIKIK